MPNDFMVCNYVKCGIPLTKSAWITKCSHVFCEQHGNQLLSTRDAKIKCLACKEIKNRDSDIIKADLNPHEMALACVRPEKALEMLNQASKLWNYQMGLKKRLSMNSVTAKQEQKAAVISRKLHEENRELKRILGEIDMKLASVNKELVDTRRKLEKYKVAYQSLYVTSRRAPSRTADIPPTPENFMEPQFVGDEFTSGTESGLRYFFN